MEWFLLRKVSLLKRYNFNWYVIKTKMVKWCYNLNHRYVSNKWYNLRIIKNNWYKLGWRINDFL